MKPLRGFSHSCGGVDEVVVGLGLTIDVKNALPEITNRLLYSGLSSVRSQPLLS